MSVHELESFAQVCADIGNKSADAEGFIPIRNLLQRFKVELIARPLLVEGMIAFINRGDVSGPKESHWAVLIDSETSGISDLGLELSQETRGRTLPVRLRNTIAHELAHSIAFRPSDFGIRFATDLSGKESQVKLVNAIEKQTERLSPLLLLATSTIKTWLARLESPVDAGLLATFRREMGVSRPALINRLSTFAAKEAGGGLPSPLQSIAVGLGEWIGKAQPKIKKWPLFFGDFEKSLVPSFLIRLQKGQDSAPASDIFGDRFSSSLTSGLPHDLRFAAMAGTYATPEAEQMDVCVSFERTSHREGSSFLFVVHGALAKASLPKSGAMPATRS